jgi:hypothetical protein
MSEKARNERNLWKENETNLAGHTGSRKDSERGPRRLIFPLQIHFLQIKFRLTLYAAQFMHSRPSVVMSTHQFQGESDADIQLAAPTMLSSGWDKNHDVARMFKFSFCHFFEARHIFWHVNIVDGHYR